MGVYTIGVAGESYRQKEIKKCREGDPLVLKREPDNRYDPCAVAVLRENGEQIGYVPRNQAEWVSRIMDEGKRVEERINKIVGETWNKPTRGVVIDINTTPQLGWDDSGERQEGHKAPFIYVSGDGKVFQDEVTPSEKRALEGPPKMFSHLPMKSRGTQHGGPRHLCYWVYWAISVVCDEIANRENK